jgi:HAD superfamily hydrolase (TIGR01509 family)
VLAVGFDFDHTLGVDNKLEKTVALDMLASLARRQGLRYDPGAAESAIEQVIRAYRAGEVTIETGIEGFFRTFLGGAGVSAARFRAEAVARAPAFVRALPGAHEMLARLGGAGIVYAILTNGWSPLQEEKARLIGFDASVLVSERIGTRKPERAAFAALAQHLGLPLEALWYVGDDPFADCAGARAAGMTAVWFDWEHQAYPAAAPPPDHVIRTLAELPDLLQGRSGGAANRRG